MSPDLLGLSSMATRHVLAALAAECPQPITFEAGGGVKVAGEIRARRACDVVVLSDDAMARLHDDGHVDSLQPLFHSEAVLAVPAGAPTPDLKTAEDLRNLLVGAQRIGYSTGPSGTALVKLLVDLGIPQDKLQQAEPGVPVAHTVADGTVDVGVQQLSEMVGAPAICILGPLPDPHASRSTFTAGVAATSQDPEAARAVVTFLGSPEHAALVSSHGLTLITEEN